MKLTTANLKNSGFTLIELLVVIGILGILAAGLLAAIDPLEQIRKGNDANGKSAAVELVKATQRYYTTHNEYPWGPVPNGAACTSPAGGAIPIGTGAFHTGAANCYNIAAGAGGLEQNGELKSTFKTNGRVTTTTAQMTIFQTAAPERRVVVCFRPESRSIQLSAESAYTTQGVLQAAPACPQAGAAGAGCFWCAQ